MNTIDQFTRQEIQYAKDVVVKEFGHGGIARGLMISVENCERGDYVRAIDVRIVRSLLHGGETR